MGAQDPGACSGRTDGYATRPPCASPACGHPCESHDISPSTKKRTRCFRASPDPCPCKRYVEPEVASC